LNADLRIWSIVLPGVGNPRGLALVDATTIAQSVFNEALVKTGLVKEFKRS